MHFAKRAGIPILLIYNTFQMKKNALLFLLFFSHFITYGQNKFTISGFIMDAGSGEKLIQAHVFDSESSSGTVSNVYGFYSITLPADSVNLIVSYIGYNAREYSIILDKNKTLNIRLSQSLEIEEVKISAEKSARIEKETQMSIITIPIKQIKKIPSLLGEVDVLKAMQLLPGVQSGGEGQSGLYVRGGSADQNLILLDGVPVYNASHLFGFFSVFNAEAISDVKLIKGGFPARYGGRLSSVVDIRMKEGHKSKYHGNASIGLLSSKFTFEGPVIKDKTSFIVSARRTYLDILARPLIKKGFSKSGSKGTAGYYFYDINAKINHKFSQKDRLYLSMYTGDDRFYSKNKSEEWGYKTNSANKLGWGNIITATRWNHLWTSRLFSNTTLTYSKYKLGTMFSYNTYDLGKAKLIEDTKLEYSSGIDDIALKIDFDYLPNPNHFIRFGASGIRHKFNPGVFDLMFLLDTEEEGESKLDTIIGQKSISAMEYAAYIEDDFSISENLKINLGVHLSGFDVENKLYHSIQPRISMRYIMPAGFALKMSYASMRQYIHLLAFSGVGLPTDLWLPTTKKVKPQDSWQAAIGLAKTINNNFDVSIEGYYKEMNNVISYKEGAGLFQFDDWHERITQGEGHAYGVELFINKKRGKWTGWIGYTLSWAWRQFDDTNFGKKYHYKYDRRHDISLVASYDITDKISFSGTWVFGTGNAITLASSSYNGFFPANDVDNLNFEANYYPEKNNFRMKSYHRLDFGFDFLKEKKKYTRKWSVGAYNTYSRKNPFFLFIDKQYKYENGQEIIKKELKQISLFPIIPYVTYSIDF